MSIGYNPTVSKFVKPPAHSPTGIKSPVRIWNLLDPRNARLHHKFLWRRDSAVLLHRLSDGHAIPPINQLPVEILGEIFGQCLLDFPPLHMRSCHRSLSPSPYTDPLVLGQVCRYWRGVTLATPALWSTICIIRPKQQHVQKVAVWLERSRGCGLSLKLIQPATPGLHDHSVTDEILSLLITQVHRWREIDFSFTSIAQQPLLMIPEGATLALESATISNELWDYASMNRLWRIIHSSPVIHYMDWMWPCNQAPDHLSISQLSHLTLRWVLNVEILIEILRSCNQVVELRLHSLWSDYSPGYFPPLVLPNLRVLSVTDATDPGPLFCRLTLPSLTSVEFTTPIRQRNDFLDLLDRSCCSLAKFTFPGLHLDEADLRGYLAAPHLGSLRELELRGPPSDRVFTSFTRQYLDEQKSWLLPKLEVLRLTNVCCTSEGLLCGTILSRLSSIGQPFNGQFTPTMR